MQTSGDQRRENAKLYRTSLRAQRSDATVSTRRAMDRFAALAMTWEARQAVVSRPAGTTYPGMEPGPRAPVTARPASISGSRISLW